MRFTIPLKGSPDINFYTEDGMIVAQGYERIVIGERGPYIEFKNYQIIHVNIFIPEDQEYRLNSDKVYYVEYRTKIGNVKIYHQKKLVKYADYKIDFYYISPSDLRTTWEADVGKGKIVIESIQTNLNNFLEVNNVK